MATNARGAGKVFTGKLGTVPSNTYRGQSRGGGPRAAAAGTPLGADSQVSSTNYGFIRMSNGVGVRRRSGGGVTALDKGESGGVS